MGRESFDTAVRPVLDVLAAADPADPGLRERLDRELPAGGPLVAALREAAEAGEREGWLCPKEGGGIRFGRPVKASAESGDLSVDAVVMDRVAGPHHRHPNGEINLCFAQDGDPRFCGHPEGWVVFPPGSAHVPLVEGGRMLILYFLPGGAIEFTRA